MPTKRYKWSDRSELEFDTQTLTSQKNSLREFEPIIWIQKKASGLNPKTLNWWALRGSNSRPSRCKRDALPAELSAHLAYREDIYTYKKNKSSIFFEKKHIFYNYVFFQ